MLDKLAEILQQPRNEFALKVLFNPTTLARIKGLPSSNQKWISAPQITSFLVKSYQRYSGLYDYRIDPTTRGYAELTYLVLSIEDRIKELRKRGIKIVAKWPVNPTDIYFGAGVLALDPFFFGFTQLLAHSDNQIAHRGRSFLSEDACPAAAAAYTAFHDQIISADFFYPFIGPWCYDSQYCFEALRDMMPGEFGDHPVAEKGGFKKQRNYDFMYKELEKFVAKMAEITGKPFDPDQLNAEIKLENQLRARVREICAFMQETDPPLSSLELILAIFIASDWCLDPKATLAVLGRICEGAKRRVRLGHRAEGVVRDPIRIQVSGIAWGDLGLYNMIDDMGAVVISSECVQNLFYEDIPEDAADPIATMTRRFLGVPYTHTAGERAAWSVGHLSSLGQVDGLIFNCNFGCNYQSTEARIVTDVIKKETGLPCMIIDTDLPKENIGQLRTRFGAFIELIKERRAKNNGRHLLEKGVPAPKK